MPCLLTAQIFWNTCQTLLNCIYLTSILYIKSFAWLSYSPPFSVNWCMSKIKQHSHRMWNPIYFHKYYIPIKQGTWLWNVLFSSTLFQMVRGQQHPLVLRMLHCSCHDIPLVPHYHCSCPSSDTGTEIKRGTIQINVLWSRAHLPTACQTITTTTTTRNQQHQRITFSQATNNNQHHWTNTFSESSWVTNEWQQYPRNAGTFGTE